MHPDVAWGLWSKERARRVESVIDNLLPPSAAHPQRLHEAMRYAVLGAGKRVLAHAAGSRGMAGGQAIDLGCVDKTLDLSELERMHRLKTGALIRAAVRLGADCGQTMDADGNDALLRYASAIGLAFQVVDDVLDVEG